LVTVTDPPAAPPPVIPGLSGLTVLARGGYATVYRALQESVAREVAVKVENRTLESERDRRRFLREARAAGRMSSHPHVVDLFDAGVTPDGHPFLMMELCDGSYADRMKSSVLDPVEARDVGVKIADALADAHALGVCHRDVKPANILITRFGEPALADFGLAILAETRDASVTLDVLTPAYAAPELFRQSPPSTAVDVYALCATLYATMRGRPPRWHDDHNPSLVTLLELFAEPVPDLPGVPRPLMDVLRLGMSNDPEARPTAERLRDMLAAVPLTPASAPNPSGRAQVGAPRGPIPPVGSWPDQPDPQDTPTVRTRKRNGRLAAAVGAGLAVAALLVATGIWYATRDGTPTADPSRSPAVGSPSAPPSQLKSAPPTRLQSGVACVFSAVVAGARCPTQPECFDRLVVDNEVARAARRSCEEAHTWETFALGPLAVATTGVTQEKVRDDPAVQALCAPLYLAALTDDPFAWQVEVLPPTPEQFAGGDRTFRCLGGKGPDKLDKPTLKVGQ
jgi:serine/threonine protein kinase